jgi:hypothetical protein
MTAGMNAAILVMLGIIGGVLTLIVSMFIILWRRAKKRNQGLSAKSFVDHEGNLKLTNEQGVVEWNNT